MLSLLCGLADSKSSTSVAKWAHQLGPRQDIYFDLEYQRNFQLAKKRPFRVYFYKISVKTNNKAQGSVEDSLLNSIESFI